MGVTGLWTVLDPAGQPVPLESLAHKVLAVDVSIWLNQAVKGFRDKSGNVLPHAHVLGLFHRVCKLLFYRIKPVFVFDGPPPQLKRDTLFRRRQRKSRASRQSDASRAKLIDNFLRSQVVAQQLQRQSQVVDRVAERGQEELASLLSQRSHPKKERDLFELPAMVQTEEDAWSSSDSEKEDIMAKLDIHNHTDIHQIDVNSPKFQALPKHRQVEVLMELREKRKQNSWAKMHEMPKEAQNFSGFQMDRLMKRSKLQRKLHEVGQELSQTAMAIDDHKLFVGDRAGLKRQKLEAKRTIQGRDFVYLDGLKAATPPEPTSSQGGKMDTIPEVRELQTDSESGEDDLDRAVAESLAQSNELSQDDLLALAEKNADHAALDGDGGDDDIMIIEPTLSSLQSSRRGGFRLPIIKAEVAMSDSDEADDPQPSTSAAPCPIPPSQPRAIEIAGEVPKPKAIEVVVDVSKPPEHDIFADIFDTTADARPSVEIMEDSEDSDDMFPDIFKPKGGADPKGLDAILSQALVKPDAKANTVEEARLESDSTVELFAQIAKKARKVEVEEVVKSANPIEVTQKMKSSDHLFLKIASKYAEEHVEEINESSNSAKAKPDVQSDLEVKLEEERETLVREMQSQGQEARLLMAKGVTSSSDKASPNPPAQRAKRLSRDEESLLESLKVATQDKESYAQDLLKDEERTVEEKASGVVYGSSAPGFLRSGSSRVVEIEPFSTKHLEPTDLDESIARKMELQDQENPENLLTKEELQQIQEQLAQDQNQLIAERGKQERMAASISDQMYADCQDLLQMFGLPWIVAPSEAEAQCAFLDMNGLTSGTITDDSDIWVFGGQNVFKNFFNQDKHCEHFTANEVAQHLGLSRERMILIALLTGSDYTLGVESVGPVTAMEVLAEFPGAGLEPLFAFADWWKKNHENFHAPPGTKLKEKLRRLTLPPTFPNENVVQAYIQPSVDNSLEAFSWAVPNFVEICDYAQDKFGWPKHKVDEIIKPVIKKFHVKISQGRIDGYFQRERVALPDKGHYQNSKRMKSAIDKVLGKKSVAGPKSKAKSGSPQVEPKVGTKKAEPKAGGSKPESHQVDPKYLEKAQKALAHKSNKPPLFRKALEDAKKEEAKLKAIQVFAAAKQGKKKAEKKAPKRVVLKTHALSDDEST
eukprot:maker-scaffold382_size189932-snap-gene-0.25 protein:Tk03704 transcript:maker-scaffold382_size189932-snap-gene-0.25-mRNA-1 annotation:"dna repair protein complementing xp-g cells-like protein"